MTDKKIDSSMDKDFNLNRFDLDGEDEKSGVFVETESFYTADLFVDAEPVEQAAEEEKPDPFDATWGADRFAELGSGKKEPSIPQESELTPETVLSKNAAMPDPAPELIHNKEQPAPDDEMPGNEAKSENIPPHASPLTDTSSVPLARQGSGTKSISIFAVLAMLVAAIAVWLSIGSKPDSDGPKQLKPQSVLTADLQVQHLETRISSLELQASQQREKMNQQMDQLQQQLSSLTSLLAKQAKKKRSVQPNKAVGAGHKSNRAHVSTSPVSTRPGSGWVVNLVSVDSKYAASKALARYKTRGISAKIFRTLVNGKTWYRLRIGGFASKQEAMAQKNYLATKYGIKDAWLQKP